MESEIASLKPPYYLVSFYSKLKDEREGYAEMAERMVALAQQQPGYLAATSVRDGERRGVTLSYWRDLEAISQWKQHMEHLEAQRQGQQKWYQWYHLEICRVERTDSFYADEKGA